VIRREEIASWLQEDETKGTKRSRLSSDSGRAGQAFGIETSGDAPTRVRSSITDRAFLVEFFVNLFEVTGTEASVRAAIQAASRPSSDDFQREVEVWLATALKP
jgi:hypothetical protein